MKTSIWRRWCQTLLHIRPAPRRRPRRSPLGVLALEDRVTPTLTPQMVFDINATTLGSNPSALVAVGSTAYFTADDGVHGVELWKSDGSGAGTALVKDVNPGTAGSGPASLTNVNGTLFFTADDGTHGPELWKTDGTAAGTVLVKDILPGAGGSGTDHLTNVNGTLFFSAYQEATGWELWKSNGTAAGTVLIKDIKPSWTGSYPGSLTNVNGTLFFSIHDYYDTYSELWKSDGTAAGTVLVKDFVPYLDGDNYARNLAGVNGTLFFSVKDATHGWELWKSNGTSAGTVLVKDINPGIQSSQPSNMIDVNGMLFFVAGDNTSGADLWKSDGTEAGTVLIKYINPPPPGGYTGGSNPNNLTDVNGTIFFNADDGIHGRELWKSDGTAAGTTLVKDTTTNPVSPGPVWLVNVNGTLLFTLPPGNVNGTPSYSTTSELWKSDGTTAGTVLVAEINAQSAYSSLSGFTNINGVLLFAVGDILHGSELWRFNGTAANTVLVKDINTLSNSGYPGLTTEVNGTLFFAANDGVNGAELWKSDGTAAGTTLVKDIYPGGGVGYYGSYYPNNSSPSNLINVNGTLFFTASDSSGSHLWKSDGTQGGTVLVSPQWWSPSNLTAVGSTLLFAADDGNGRELWKSDGTAAGTVLVKDIYPGQTFIDDGYGGGWWEQNSSSPSNLTNVNGTLFFTADDGVTGQELWKSDGTAAGTVPVKDINPGSGSSGPAALTNINGTLYFAANDGTVGRELWKSDGSAAGTVLVKDIRSGSSGSYPSSLFDFNGTLFFQANDGTTGGELWKSDGTVPGTVLVNDINPGSGSSGPQAQTNVNGTFFFEAYTSTAGWELWKSNGTSSGTVLVKDIGPGTASSYPHSLTNLNGTLILVANSTLWQSDGTTAGTVPIANLAYPDSLIVFNDTLVFSANDGTHGEELWKLVDDGTQTTNLTVDGFPAIVTASVAGSFTITAKFVGGTTNTGYVGTVHFNSSDFQAVLPTDYTFTAADQGVHVFSANLKTAGTQSIEVQDTLVPGTAGSQSGITVNPAAASRLTVGGFPSPITAGVAGNFTVTAWDPYGNRATGYTSAVHFTSNDSKAVLPGNYNFTAADAGMHSFSATLKTSGTQSLTATDTANSEINGAQGGILVNAAAASRYLVSAPASVSANAAFSMTVTVVDAFGNVVTGYRGTIAFRSSDPTAHLPKKYTFTAADQGVHTITGLQLKKKGKQTITVYDTLNSSLTNSVNIQVL